MTKPEAEGDSILEVVRTRKRGFPHTGWAWEDIVDDFEQQFAATTGIEIGSSKASSVSDGVGRALARLGIALPRRSGPLRFVAMMGTKPRLLFPHALKGRLVLFVWDCWPIDELRWKSIFNFSRPEYVFFTAKSAASYWAPRIPYARVEWLPEAIKPELFRERRPLVERPTFLLEIGRRHQQFHETARATLHQLGVRHVYSSATQPFIFPTRKLLIEGILDSSLMACFPASSSDPSGRSRGWETMTYRYLEAAAAGCLIVGKIPDEMKEVFGFTPGVEIEAEEAAHLLPVIHENLASYQDLVDRTYDRLLKVATWEVRVEQVIAATRSLGAK